MQHRSTSKSRPAGKPLAPNIGWRAPAELRDRLLKYSEAMGWSCNHCAVELVEAALDLIYQPKKPLHRCIQMGRAVVQNGLTGSDKAE
jgi:hypothetical protein